MKRSRFSEEQIAYALRLAESGTPVVDVCRQIGVSEATYYTWKKKFGDLGVSEFKHLKMLEDENARFKRIVITCSTCGPLRGQSPSHTGRAGCPSDDGCCSGPIEGRWASL